MAKVKTLVAPDNFISLKVVKNTLEFIRFEGDLETRSILKTIVTRLDGRSLKLTGFKELLKIRAAEAKVPFPKKYDWDSFFRDTNHMNEMKAGERPDTIHFQNLPCKWFADKKSIEKPVPSEKLFRRVWEIFGDVRCIDIPVLDPYRQQMQSNIAGIKTFTFSQDAVFEAYVQYKDYLSFVKAMDALRGSFLMYQEDSKTWVASIKVNFDKTKHLSDESIKRRRIERERLAEIARREALKVAKTNAETLEANTIKKNALAAEEAANSKQQSGRVELKIALEERKYMVARRKLEAIRLLDYLFERVKKQREKDMKQYDTPPATEEFVSRRRSEHQPSFYLTDSSTSKRNFDRAGSREYSRERSYSDKESPPERRSSPPPLPIERDYHHEMRRQSPRLQYMNDWEMQQQNRPGNNNNNNYYQGRQNPYENRGGRSRGNFRGRGRGSVMRYSRGGGGGFRPYQNQPSFYDNYAENNSISLTAAYDRAYEKYFNSISKRHDDDSNHNPESQDNFSMGEDDSRRYSRSRSRSRSVSYSRSQSPRHYSKR